MTSSSGMAYALLLNVLNQSISFEYSNSDVGDVLVSFSIDLGITQLPNQCPFHWAINIIENSLALYINGKIRESRISLPAELEFREMSAVVGLKESSTFRFAGKKFLC